MSNRFFSWARMMRSLELAHDMRTTPIGDNSLYIDHWRGSARIRRGDQAIVISKEEIEIMAKIANEGGPK